MIIRATKKRAAAFVAAGLGTALFLSNPELPSLESITSYFRASPRVEAGVSAPLVRNGAVAGSVPVQKVDVRAAVDGPSEQPEYSEGPKPGAGPVDDDFGGYEGPAESPAAPVIEPTPEIQGEVESLEEVISQSPDFRSRSSLILTTDESEVVGINWRSRDGPTNQYMKHVEEIFGSRYNSATNAQQGESFSRSSQGQTVLLLTNQQLMDMALTPQSELSDRQRAVWKLAYHGFLERVGLPDGWTASNSPLFWYGYQSEKVKDGFTFGPNGRKRTNYKKVWNQENLDDAALTAVEHFAIGRSNHINDGYVAVIQFSENGGRGFMRDTRRNLKTNKSEIQIWNSDDAPRVVEVPLVRAITYTTKDAPDGVFYWPTKIIKSGLKSVAFGAISGGGGIGGGLDGGFSRWVPGPGAAGGAIRYSQDNADALSYLNEFGGGCPVELSILRYTHEGNERELWGVNRLSNVGEKK